MTPENAENRRLKGRTHPLETAALLAALLALVLFFFSLWTVLGIPYGIDFGEGYLANASLQLVRGGNPYHQLDSPPWVVTSYPPLFLVLNGLMMLFFGPVLAPGRFLAAVSFLGILAWTYLILRRLGAGTTSAVLCSSLLLFFPWTVNWAQVVRVDTLGVFFAAGGICIWLRGRGKMDPVTAGIVMALAVFTKHSLLAAPLAVILFCLVSKERRVAAFLLSFCAAIALEFGVAQVLTQGGLVLHLFHYTVNAYFLERFTAGLSQYYRTAWLIEVAAASAFIASGTLSGQRQLMGWYYVLSHLTLILYGFEGSDTNYFIEPLLSTVLLAGLVLSKIVEGPNETAQAGLPLPSGKMFGLLFLLTVFLLGRFVDPGQYRIHRANPERIRNGVELIRLASGARGDILSEDASFPLLAGKQVIFQPYIMSLLSRTGKWDQSPLVETIKQRQYSMIVLRVDLNDPSNTEVRGGAWEVAGFDRWTPEMEQAIKENYTLYGGLDVGVGNLWYVYLPAEQ